MSRSVLQQLPERVALPAGQIDTGVHGVLGVRLVNAGPADAAVVSRQLGTRSGRSRAEPDIIVEFVEDLASTGLCRIDSPEARFAGDGLLRLRHRGKQVAIDFCRIGRRCRIVCETGIERIPLLESIADVSILSRGLAAMHASALVHRGRGILATGWTHGGKSTAMLAFARHGAAYVSDDRVWLGGDGERIYGFPGVITLKERHLEELSGAGLDAGLPRRMTARSLRRIESGWNRLDPSRNGGSLASKVMRKGVAGLRRRLALRVRPEQVFDRVETAPAARLRTAFVMVRHDRPEVRIEPISTHRLTTCAWASAQRDLQPLAEHYLAFRFAYPELRNGFLEKARRRHGEILSSALRGRQAFAVYHPPDVTLSTLYREMEVFS